MSPARRSCHGSFRIARPLATRGTRSRASFRLSRRTDRRCRAPSTNPTRASRPNCTTATRSPSCRRFLEGETWALGFGLWALGFGLWALGFGLWALPGFWDWRDSFVDGPEPRGASRKPSVQLPPEPLSRRLPFAIDRPRRDAERGCGFFDGQAAEEPELDDLR